MNSTQELVGLASQGLLLCLYVSLPVIVVSAGSGLLIAFFQAITSTQDQSLSHSVKLIAVVATIMITGGWSAAAIVRFATRLLTTAIPS